MMAGTLHECPDNCDSAWTCSFPLPSLYFFPAPTHDMVLSEKGLFVIACSERMVDLPKSAPSSIRALRQWRSHPPGRKLTVLGTI